MRALDFLTEAGLSAIELRKHEGKYLLKLVQKIQAGEPLTTLDGDVYFDEQEADRLMRLFFAHGDSNNVNLDDKNNIVPPAELPKQIFLRTTDGKEIAVGRITKTAEFKDKKAGYVTIGDISEIALGLAVYTRFRKQGQQINRNDFIAAGQTISVGPGKERSSTGLITSNVRWPVGKQDVLHFRSVLSYLSMKYFVEVCDGTTKPDSKTNIVIESCIRFANEAEMVTKAIDHCRRNLESNRIDITCDGVSDQRGTKADLHLNIDGKAVNLLSLKVDQSQLGQASGHDFNKQVGFFRDMFGVDITPYGNTWGKTYQDHFFCIANVWSQVTDNIIQKVSGDNTQREMQIIRSLVNGIIKYSGGEQDARTVIIKVTAKPSGKAYQILRIDQKLHDALEEVNLVAEPVQNGAGVKIMGIYKNSPPSLLIQARSYKSDSGKVFRTVIEGGNLLDVLTAISAAQDAEKAAEKPAVKAKTVAPAQPAKTAPAKPAAPVKPVKTPATKKPA
jgi:hypothetical protein